MLKEGKHTFSDCVLALPFFRTLKKKPSCTVIDNLIVKAAVDDLADIRLL
jgi:hypothetical protein